MLIALWRRGCGSWANDVFGRTKTPFLVRGESPASASAWLPQPARSRLPAARGGASHIAERQQDSKRNERDKQ
jgi:hypothetical protein